ncbi:MAG: hypothetical protein ARM1_0679 [Candidatus Micrarchaeota archaeon]|nr:MAG: hypothetical protein ARM1_0679 [Candidatus Micrarchaeota archaeon]
MSIFKRKYRDFVSKINELKRSKGYSYDKTIKLFAAIRDNDYDTAAELIKDREVDINASIDGVTPLSLILSRYESSHYDLYLTEDEYSDRVDALIINREDFNPNISLSGKKRYLHIAAESDNSLAIKLLLDRGADPNKRDVYGDTPLICLIESLAPYPETVSLLLEYGADPNIKDNAGRTALDVALEELGHLKRLKKLEQIDEDKLNNLYKIIEMLYERGGKYSKRDILESFGIRDFKV